MANFDNPHGLQPLMRTLSGGVPMVEEYIKASGTAYPIYQWDAVALDSNFRLISSTGITPGSTLYSGVSLNYGAASTQTRHLVMTSADAIYQCQDNNDTNGIAETDLGLNANLELNAGNALTKISGHEIDESTINTTATLDVKLLGLLKTPDNEFGSWCRVEIMFNKHRMNPGVAGV